MKTFITIFIGLFFTFGQSVSAQDNFYFSVAGSITKPFNIKKVCVNYEIVGEKSEERVEVKANKFALRKAIVQPTADGMTFSAGTAYVSTVRYELRKKGQFVKFIGEEPGDDLNSGVDSDDASAMIVLPNSKIKVNIPLLGGGNMPYSNKEKVVIPDYKVIPTVKDLVNGTDAELNFTIDLIKKRFLK